MVSRDKSQPGVCKDFEQDLVLYYYRECAAKERLGVESHLKGCAGCQQFLADLSRLLPLTVKPDEPPPVFWQSYSSELHRKLAAAEHKLSWRGVLAAYFRPWSVPALATALILVLALTFTFGKRMWRWQDLPPEDEAVLEILPMAENLEFFKAMELLDSMDLLDSAAGAASGAA